MYFYGKNGAWCEVVGREKRTFMGYTLHKNQVFGRDKKSPFVVTHIVTDAAGQKGIHATLRLHRLDPNRGWIEVWEYSQTSMNAIVMYRKHNPHARITRESRECYVNPLQEVKGQKYFQPIC